MASRCSGVLRAFSRPSTFTRPSRITTASRCFATATEPAKSSPAPQPPAPKSGDATVSRIVDDIAGLTLLQAADLVTQLKSRLNIQEIAMPAAAAAPAAASAAGTAAEEPAEEKPKEKTIFNVKLESFDAGAKPKIIREVKAFIPNLTLMDAKKFVESLPKVLKENLPKEEAEKLKKTFEGLGAVVKLD
ncbi:putative ribosomal protein [Lyophyllum shimeji]|uniref:Ribosomal protein n=1 Tax=Lyophyllum shimeji TaxID=47721 RepID=A0A9P3UJJ5_LYOSH|nr:putative ribosomal protein [Lyophyllum shimeji]